MRCEGEVTLVASEALRQVSVGFLRRMAVESPRPRRIANWRHAPWLAVATVCFGAFMGQLDASIVTLAFPAMSARFHTGLAGVEWVSLAYLLTLVALLAGVGRLADSIGRKQLYLYGFALFTIASVACGLAPTLPTLIGCRVVQAVGAAMLQANSVALVTTSVPANRMRAALGVQAAAQALGLALGPTLGGLLVDRLGWQWVFLVNVPVGVVGVVAGRFLLPRTRSPRSSGRFDWLGLVLLATGSTAVLLVVSSASGLGLPLAALVGLAVVGLVAVVGFVARQRRAHTPLVDLRLLRTPAVSGGLLAALGGYLLLFGPLVLVPVLLTGAAGSALRAGLVSTALPVGFGIAATLGSRLLPHRWSNRRRSVTGAAVCFVALCAAVPLPPSAPVLAVVLGALGVGLGLLTPANNAVVLAAIPPTQRGLGGGLVNMARGLGTSLGVAGVTLTLHLTGTGGGAGWALGMLAVVAAGVAGVSVLAGGPPTAGRSDPAGPVSPAGVRSSAGPRRRC
jgi:EmrB/QacA subfamily drug resistance transporter